jgi:hypothetical protein
MMNSFIFIKVGRKNPNEWNSSKIKIPNFFFFFFFFFYFWSPKEKTICICHLSHWLSTTARLSPSLATVWLSLPRATIFKGPLLSLAIVFCHPKGGDWPPIEEMTNTNFLFLGAKKNIFLRCYFFLK